MEPHYLIDKKELLNIIESCPVGAIVIEEEKEA